MARGTDTAASDIDLLVVADEMTLEERHSALAPVETTLARRINPTLCTPTEYEARKAAGNGFLARILAGEHVVLIKRDDEPSAARYPEHARQQIRQRGKQQAQRPRE